MAEHVSLALVSLLKVHHLMKTRRGSEAKSGPTGKRQSKRNKVRSDAQAKERLAARMATLSEKREYSSKGVDNPTKKKVCNEFSAGNAGCGGNERNDVEIIVAPEKVVSMKQFELHKKRLLRWLHQNQQIALKKNETGSSNG